MRLDICAPCRCISEAHIRHHRPRVMSFNMMQWVDWLQSDDALRYDPITRAAIAHHDFEVVHPFISAVSARSARATAWATLTTNAARMNTLPPGFSICIFMSYNAIVCISENVRKRYDDKNDTDTTRKT